MCSFTGFVLYHNKVGVMKLTNTEQKSLLPLQCISNEHKYLLKFCSLLCDGVRLQTYRKQKGVSCI